jgi:glycerol uptake facilitator-like aquaporin
MEKKWIIGLGLLTLMVLLSGCTGKSTNPEVTPAPTTTPEVTPAPTTTPEVTPAPTMTPEVTPAPTMTPMVILSLTDYTLF